MSFLNKCDMIIEKAVAYFCAFLFACIILVCLAGVIWRYVLNNPLVWSEEVARFLSIWMILVGSSMTVRIDGHTSIDLMQTIIKNPTGRMVSYVITRALAALSMLLMFPFSVQLLKEMGGVTAAATRLPMWAIYLAFPVGIVCMLIAWIRCIPKFAREVKEEALKEEHERAIEKGGDER